MYNLQRNCAVLEETSIVAIGRPTVGRKDLILCLNTTEGVGMGAGLQMNNILPTNTYCTPQWSV